ncbi:MAG: hypothetical protein GX620_04270 [Chloroflexi bacterium]|nr:hypothetical protein [Chloroflexota bacterium]
MTDAIDLREIERWLDWPELEWSRFGPMCVRLLRALTEVGVPEDAMPAASVAHDLLDAIDCALDQPLACSSSESARLFSVLLTILAEAGQYRFETRVSKESTPQDRAIHEYLDAMAQLRERAILVAQKYLRQPVFDSLACYIEAELDPLLSSLGDISGQRSTLARDRYMPYRVVQVGNVAELLYSLRLRTEDPLLVGDRDRPGLLKEIYQRKYIRFGTSGVRGRWGLDFTESLAKRVVQAICDFLKATDVPGYVGADDLQGKRIIIGYDTRKNARQVAEWTAQVCLANGFLVDFANRDIPTPALVYYLTDFLPRDEVAGLINCTASHNPPEWQGIKFNPRDGYPAPTNVTNYIAARANYLQLLNESAAEMDLSQAEAMGWVRGFDPLVHYTEWVLRNGEGNARIPIDVARIRHHFRDGCVVVDEMHGSSRGYLTRLLGEIGVRHKVIHAERDPNLPGLEYANPEEPFIDTLKETVRDLDDAMLGLGMDTDGDRFGVVDADGTYYRPNQVLPMLVRYLGVDRKLTGRVIATQTGSPLLERLAGIIPGNEEYKPEPGVVPAFVGHPFYHRQVGEREDRVFEHTFMVPVGIKYIEEQRRTDRRYQFHEELPDNWRDVILIGGEESSGLTTRGHVTDKDGIWANLLIMDMIASYGKPLAEIWKDTVSLAGWESFGGLPGSNSGRVDVDAVLEAKEGLIDDLLDRFEGERVGEVSLEGLPIDGLPRLDELRVIYAGGIRYEFVEVQLRDALGGDQHFLRVRASGTEPINRIYVESSDPEIAHGLMQVAVRRLEELSAKEIGRASSEWRLAEILIATAPTPRTIQAAQQVIRSRRKWQVEGIIARLTRILPTVERRNQRVLVEWIGRLNDLIESPEP